MANSSPKHELAATAAQLGIEHADALRAAFAVGAPSSAAALLRLLYEAVLRSAWLLYAAPAGQAEQASKNVSGWTPPLRSGLLTTFGYAFGSKWRSAQNDYWTGIQAAQEWPTDHAG